MILAISRFRVVNGMEKEVAEAFIKRPRLVEDAPGFLGMEVFQPPEDAAAFHLMTRWVDEASFRAWHSSPKHHESHRWIPRGLKVDPSYTKIQVLNRLDEQSRDGIREQLAMDSSRLLADLAFTSARALFVMKVDANGTIVRCTPSIAEVLGIVQDATPPARIWDHLTERDAQTIRQYVAESKNADRMSMLVNFTNLRLLPESAMCTLSREPSGNFTVVGELQRSDMNEELLRTNNEMALMQRELARSKRVLQEQYVNVSEQATRDALTHVFNRLYFDAELPRHLSRSTKSSPLCLIILDIDHFKLVNDEHGHLAGDAVLRAIGRHLLDSVRPTDVVARYGGEEFVVVLPNTTFRDTSNAAERLRSSLGRMGVEECPVPITASFGVGCAGPGEDPVSFLARVDAALYKAKRDGRNCVRFAQQPLP